jgi:hypothetical protein
MSLDVASMVENFTVSYSVDVGIGKRSNHFVSMTFRIPPGTPPDQVEIIRLDASKKVSLYALQDAVMRGEINSDDAKDRMEILKMNHEGMKSSMLKRIEEARNV